MKQAKTSYVRIIAGAWRGRRIPFLAHAGLRPTPDRVRETLFNWLGNAIVGARCLDLFAGSGALGFEALSRGAAEVVMADANPLVVKQLQAVAEQLHTQQLATYAADYQAIPQLLSSGDKASRPFDVVFLDPPFGQAMVPAVALMLQKHKLCAASAWVYTEIAKQDSPLHMPDGYQVYRCKQAGQVEYGLWRLV